MQTKQIKHGKDSWNEIKALAEQLSLERGSRVSMPSAVAEAVKFFKDNRPKAN